MTDELIKQIKKVKQASYNLVLLNKFRRNSALQHIADKLRKSSNIILAENAKDLALMSKEDPMYDRLLLSRDRVNQMADNIESVVKLECPLGNKIAQKVMTNGLRIEKITVPIGVIAVIYESRPNVTIDVFTLCFKTGNACILKGGKEAHFSNNILVHIIHEALLEQDIDPNILYLLPLSREAANAVMNAAGLVDVCIPRGSQSLINFVRENAKIPVIETGAGIVHTYFDESGDINKGCLIINNAKTRRVSVCNALDCLLVHKTRLDDLHKLVEPLIKQNVEIYADQQAYEALEPNYPSKLLGRAEPKHFGQEFLSYKLAIKTVASIQEAVQHIMNYTSGHSEAIIAEDRQVITHFLARVDAAAVYVNASTAFTDGGEFGMGSEIGISTQKLHARGPMGLEALTSYKWIVFGDGHVREA